MLGDDRIYTEEEIIELLDRADRLGLSLESGSDIEKLTIADLERLVNYKC